MIHGAEMLIFLTKYSVSIETYKNLSWQESLTCLQISIKTFFAD